MSYGTQNEIQNFEYNQAVVGNIQVTDGIFHLVLDNVMILPENSCNRDIRKMRCNDLLLKLAEPEIIEVIEEGYKLFDANGGLKESVEDKQIAKAEYPKVWNGLLGGNVYEINKKMDDSGKYRYEFVIDGAEEGTYDVHVLATGDTQEWERFLNIE